jgi:hypothetical protein
MPDWPGVAEKNASTVKRGEASGCESDTATANAEMVSRLVSLSTAMSDIASVIGAF